MVFKTILNSTSQVHYYFLYIFPKFRISAKLFMCQISRVGFLAKQHFVLDLGRIFRPKQILIFRGSLARIFFEAKFWVKTIFHTFNKAFQTFSKILVNLSELTI